MLKYALCKALMLAYPDFDVPYIVDTDTRNLAIGAVFSQVTVKFSYYLLGQDFTLKTNNSSLRWLDLFHDKATDVLARLLHYMEPFRPYMTIMYRS
ncbi:MAG: hypothetical protein JJV94_07120 [Sulfurospirillum sp.]|nr:hypothetical protein [Sulfurospirillum sp.]